MLASLLLVALGTACASLDADVHLAPLYTRLSTADQAVESEALGGFFYERWERSEPGDTGTSPDDLARRLDPASGDEANLVLDPPASQLTARALRPLWGWRRLSADRSRTDFIVPLGYYSKRGDQRYSTLLPLYYWHSAPANWHLQEDDPRYAELEGQREFDFFGLPGVFWSRNERGAEKLAVFPLYGDLDRFLTYDNVKFALFPLWLKVERDGETLQNVLFPLFGFTSSGDRTYWRAWPLVGVKNDPGQFKRWFFLWPIFSRQIERLDSPESQRIYRWWVWPLFGRTAQGSYRSYSFLWPFFGWAWDPRGAEEGETGGAFWALDAPWPVIRLQGGGKSPLAEERLRLWPFTSHFKGNELEIWTWLWPLFQRRLETGPDYRRASFYIMPFWQDWDMVRDDGRVESWRRLWPLARYERRDQLKRWAFFSFDPLQRSSVIDFFYGWLWELYAVERERDRSKHRSWLGLYRRERHGNEVRESLPILWGRRQVETPVGTVHETSLLCGLLRWRTGPPAAKPGLLRPAFPGPGWSQAWTEPPPRDSEPGIEDTSLSAFLRPPASTEELPETEAAAEPR